ncbi:flagellar hook-length control protein FliK [Thiohalobacter sp. IOR34]|uniref:flagellar hook-length control protein FliK n=1 Tax=Thiohalobacter sp. IOR34 TaxID=3057176 RepID=UPI0025AED1C9|nr:flagellar hook-length control protein FliK [Thiohalobacter sp. IOR34]WJW74548.1 flagellar hook-length control protein FliK [Thiohalobacter sp. IOR34]
MQPTGPRLPPLPTSPGSTGPSPGLRLRIGQTLNAVVLTSPRDGRTLLRIGANQVQARTGALQLSPGQALKLQVVRLGEQPLLRLITALRQDAVSEALRQVLPRQRPLGPILSGLAQLAARPAVSPLPPAVLARLRELIDRLPRPGELSNPRGLQQALRDSGTFLEARLAAGAPPADPGLGRDLKANLLRLAAALRQASASAARAAPSTASRPGAAAQPPTPAAASEPASAAGKPPSQAAGEAQRPGANPLPASSRPPQPQSTQGNPADRAGRVAPPPPLLEQVEAALSRVRLHQLKPLSAERPHGLEWLFELPVRRDSEHIDLWQLYFRREDRPGGQEKEQTARWTVLLSFDLPGLGPLQARITLQGESRLSTLFLGSEEAALPLVERHLPRLRARLEQAGLEVETLGCRRGRLPQPKPATGSGPVVDEKA